MRLVVRIVGGDAAGRSGWFTKRRYDATGADDHNGTIPLSGPDDAQRRNVEKDSRSPRWPHRGRKL